MELTLKIVWFIAFIVAFFAFMAFGAYLNQTRIPRDLVRGKWLANTLLQTFLGIAFLLVSIWLLSGFWSWALAGLLAGAGVMSIVVTIVLWSFLVEAENKDWGAMVISASSRAGMEHPLLSCAPMIVGLLLILAYPTAMGIVYFTHELPRPGSPQPELTLLVIRCAVAYTFVAWIMTQPMNIAVLMSKHLDQEGRTRRMVAMGGSIIPFALYLALALWSLGGMVPVPTVGGPSVSYKAGDVSLEFSWVLVTIVFALFGLTVLFPYFLGVYRGQRWRLGFQDLRSRWLIRIIDVLDVPTASRYASNLAALKNDLQSEIAVRTEEEDQADPRNADPKVLGALYEPLVEAYERFRPFDPKAQYLDWLRQLNQRLDTVEETLAARKTGTGKEINALRWAKAFMRRRGQVQAEVRETKQARPIAWATGSAILWLLISTILGEVAKWGWIAVQHGSAIQPP